MTKQKRKLNILFIDDHKLILQGYKLALEDCVDFNIEFHSQTNTTDAYSCITSKRKDYFDVIFYDIGMGKNIVEYEDDDRTGFELACKVNEYTQHPKIGFITGYSDMFLFDRIIKKLSPKSILVKDELDIKDLIHAINKIVNGSVYFSDSVMKNIINKFTSRGEIDDIDEKILFYISKGVLSKNLHTKIDGISQSGIEKRKLKIKSLFEVEEYSDFAIVNEAKRRGLI